MFAQGKSPVVRHLFVSTHPILLIETGDEPRFLQDPRLTPWQNFVGESESAIIVKNIFYPFEVAQTLMQTNAPDAKEGIVETLSHLYKTYGISALYRGNIASNLSETVFALGGFIVKALMHNQPTFENRVLIFLSSLVPLQLVSALVYPLQVAKVRMITNPSKYLDVVQTVKTINDEEGAAGLYRGLGFALLERIPLLASSYAAFELASLVFRKPREDLSVKENILFAILGTTLAALLHYPFETAKKIVQSRKGPENEGVLKTLAEEGEKHGLVGLYKGASALVFKAPSLLIQRAIYQAAQVYFLRSNGYPTPYLHPAYPRRATV